MQGLARIRTIQWTTLACAASAAAFMLLATSASAAPKVDGEFSVSGLGTYNAITQGPDGNMWVTLDATNDVAKITPQGNVQQFNPTSLNNPVGITRQGNNLWVTQTGGVAKFSPGNPNGAVATPIAGIGEAHDITVGPDGNLWTASATTVFRIPPGAPGTSSPFALLTTARGIAAGGDGNIWVADLSGKIVRLTTAGAPAPGSPYIVGGGPQGIAAGPGTQMAFANAGVGPPHELGRITPGGTPQITKIGTSDPFGITLGPDGAYWIGRFSTNNIGRLTTSGQFTSLGGFSANAGPRQLAPGPGNTLWVTLQTADKVARVTGVTPPSTGPAPDKTAPDSQIDKGPKKKIKTKKKKKKVKFLFSSADPTATFQCSFDDADFEACTSPEKIKVKAKRKAKKHSFAVRATDAAGNVDQTADELTFKVKRKK